MTEQEIYLGAKQLLSSKDKWIKGTCAKNSKGEVVTSYDSEAVCFCLLGAIQRITGKEIVFFDVPSLTKLIRPYGIAGFNDSENTTYEDVIRVLDEAINKT